ncbi:MAG TPA: hypothetical protein VJ021_03055 [Thermoplasmata archaeon]|nr:hypothetical protein [Thermoplasmata archaeon]
MSVTTTTTSTRPLGVAILAFLVGLFGVLIIIGGLLILAAATVPAFLGVPGSFVGESGAIWGVIVLIIGLIILGLALGLWHLRMWALVLTLIVVFIEIVSFALAGNYVSLGFVLSLIIFVYLLAVNRHFR